MCRGRESSRSGAKADLDRTAYRQEFGVVGATLLEQGEPGEGRRSARFERTFCPAAIAPAVTQDAVDHTGVGNEGNNAHAGAAGGASQRVGLEYFPDQTSPRAAGLPREIGIVPGLG